MYRLVYTEKFFLAREKVEWTPGFHLIIRWENQLCIEDSGTNSLYCERSDVNCLHEFRSKCFNICYGMNQTFEKFRLVHDTRGR